MKRTAIETIEREAEWVPQRIDWPARRVIFHRIPDPVFVQPGFLHEFEPAAPGDVLSIRFDDVHRLKIDAAPLHFIFHSAFCKSTLLARALNIPGCSIGMAEPGIFAALASRPEEAAALMQPLLGALGRQRANARAVFAKPTNHANRLVPALLESQPQARAILMTGSLASYLQSVRRRALMGHRWGRKLYLEMQSYAPVDFGMQPEEVFLMTDLQAAGIAWLLNQQYFANIAKSRFGDRTRILNADRFDEHRKDTLEALLSFCNVGCPPDTSMGFDQHPAFMSHAKLGGAFRKSEKPDQATSQEILQVCEWIDAIAAQMGLSVPLQQTLVKQL